MRLPSLPLHCSVNGVSGLSTPQHICEHVRSLVGWRASRSASALIAASYQYTNVCCCTSSSTTSNTSSAPIISCLVPSDQCTMRALLSTCIEHGIVSEMLCVCVCVCVCARAGVLESCRRCR